MHDSYGSCINLKWEVANEWILPSCGISTSGSATNWATQSNFLFLRYVNKKTLFQAYFKPREGSLPLIGDFGAIQLSVDDEEEEEEEEEQGQEEEHENEEELEMRREKEMKKDKEKEEEQQKGEDQENEKEREEEQEKGKEMKEHVQEQKLKEVEQGDESELNG